MVTIKASNQLDNNNNKREEGVPEVNLGGVKCHFISANENNNLSMCESMVESNKNGHWHNN